MDAGRSVHAGHAGAALGPVRAGVLGRQDDDQLRDLTRRFWVALSLSVPVLVISMGGLLPAAPRGIVELALATPVSLWAGWPFLVRAASSLRTRSANMYTLVGLGVGVAYAYSVVTVIAPGLFPPSVRDGSGHVSVYFEAATGIVTLNLLGQILELRARRRARAAIGPMPALCAGTSPPRRPAATQKLVDTVAGRAAPAVVLIAAATFLVWALAGPSPRVAHAVVCAIAVLVVASPCAIGLASPTSIAVAMGRAASEGVLFDGADAIDAMCQVDTLVVLSGIAQPVEPATLEPVRALRADRVRVVMLTDAPPEEADDAVARMQASGRLVATLGDGIDDGTVAARAQVAIVMGAWAAPVSAATVRLVERDLWGVVRARRLSRAAMRNVRQGLFFAFVYNGAGVLVASGLLYPFFGVLLSPMIAAAAMSLSAASIIANALRLRGMRL